MNCSRNFGLVGLGKMGKNHLRILSTIRNISKIFVYDTNKKATASLEKNDFVFLADSLEELSNKVDTVIVSSPTSTHHDLLEYFIGKVKNIFVEKPLCENSIQAEKIVKLCKQKNTSLSVGFIERFNPVIEPLKRMFKQPCINADFFRTDKVSSRIKDVDVIADLMIHDIDLALYLNGDVVSINGYGTIINNQIFFACATLAHENGSFSRLMASKLTEKKMRYIDVTFEDKFVNCNLLNRNLLIHRQTTSTEKTDKEYIVSASSEQVHLLPSEPLYDQLTTLVNKKSKLSLKIANEIEAYQAQKIGDEIRNEIFLKSTTNSSLASINILQKQLSKGFKIQKHLDKDRKISYA